jgi:hypothetical protein
MKTTTTTTTTTTNQNLNIVALSVPVINKNNSGFKTTIASTVYTESLKFNKYEFLKRMYDLGLRSMVLILVTDEDDIGFKINEFKESFGTEDAICSLKVIFVNYNNFFSLNGIEYFFTDRKNKNFETLYAFKGKS